MSSEEWKPLTFQGKMIGAILNALLAQVLNNPELNEYEKLEELALKIYQEVQ